MRLLASSLYLPRYVETNDTVIEYFEEQNVSMKAIQAQLGRVSRHVSRDAAEDNTLSMAVAAAEGAVKSSGLTIADIDMILFVTSTPEQLVPCGAMLIHDALKGAPHTMCYDLNANCIGTFIALQQAAMFLSGNKRAQRAMVVSSEHFSRVVDAGHPVTAFCFTDSAFAFILDKDGSDSGYIDSRFRTDPSFKDTIVFPKGGYSYCNTVEPRIFWSEFDGRGSVEFMHEELELFLAQHGLTINDISLFLFSQFSYKNISLIRDHFDIPEEKIPLVCYEIGYTGASSPLVTLHEHIRKGNVVNKGDYLLIWTLGAGYQAGMMLWKY